MDLNVNWSTVIVYCGDDGQPIQPPQPPQAPEKPEEPNKGNPNDEICLIPENSNAMLQTVTLFKQRGCSGSLKQELTDANHSEAMALKYGGKFCSAELPAYSTLVFYDNVNLEGDIHEYWNSNYATKCIDLCDLSISPASAEAFFSERV